MITAYGLSNRDCTIALQNEIFQKFNVIQYGTYDEKLSDSSLGKNLLGFIYENDGKKLLVLVDGDDGSGGTPTDCKIVWHAFNNILQQYQPNDYIIFKLQVNSDPECNQFYPFKNNVYPIGIFTNNPYAIFEVKKSLPQTNKDIDVFFPGGRKFSKNRPYAWPKHRDIRKWWAGAAIRGYEKLLNIRESRKDLNIVCLDQNVSQREFFDLVSRSKVCIDFPGIGLSTRKFYEYCVLEKCVISLKQQLTCWPCEENVHYVSLGEDLNFDSLEEKIDFVIGNVEFRNNIENNLRLIENDLRIESIASFVCNKIEQHVKNLPQHTLLCI